MIAKRKNQNKRMSKRPVTYQQFSKFMQNLPDIAFELQIAEKHKTLDECAKWYYEAFYSIPAVREKYEFKLRPCSQAMRNRLLQLPVGRKDTKMTAQAVDVGLGNDDGVEVNEAGLGRFRFPVTFETFEQHVDKDKLLRYLVRKHIKEAERQAYLSNASKGRKMLRRYYITFYINPSHRLSSKHDYLRVPNDLCEKFLLPGKPLDELAHKTMGNQGKSKGSVAPESTGGSIASSSPAKSILKNSDDEALQRQLQGQNPRLSIAECSESRVEVNAEAIGSEIENLAVTSNCVASNISNSKEMGHTQKSITPVIAETEIVQLAEKSIDPLTATAGATKQQKCKQKSNRKSFANIRDWLITNKEHKSNNSIQPPVTLKTFSKFIENLSDIAYQVKATEIECMTKTIDECVKWYYGAFYSDPDVRKTYEFKVKPCPRAMRDKLLQIPGSVADKENTADVELVNANGVEVNEHGLGRFIFPVTFETFEQHVDKDKLLPYLVRGHIKDQAKRQAYLSDESKGRRMLRKYYLTFYINPSHRLSSKHNYLRVPNALREKFLLPGKPLDKLALKTMRNQGKSNSSVSPQSIGPLASSSPAQSTWSTSDDVPLQTQLYNPCLSIAEGHELQNTEALSTEAEENNAHILDSNLKPKPNNDISDPISILVEMTDTSEFEKNDVEPLAVTKGKRKQEEHNEKCAKKSFEYIKECQVEIMDKSSKPPVTFMIFNKFIENLSDIAFQVKVCEVECRTKTTDECAKWYYEAFYNQPEVRRKYEYRLKSCPKAMRDKLLQIPESIDDKQIKAQGADYVEFNLHGRGRFLFPVTFETFQQYVDQDKLLPYLLRKHFKDKTKRQAYISDAAICRKVLRKYYNTFYIYPNLRLKSKHDFLKVPDALRERLWLPGKPLDEMAQNAVAKQGKSKGSAGLQSIDGPSSSALAESILSTSEDVSLQRQLHAQNSRSSITECHESQVDDDADAVDSETEDLVVVDKRVASNISNNVEMTETPKSSKTSTVEARTEFAEKSIEPLTVNTKQNPIGKSFGNIRDWLVTNKEHKSSSNSIQPPVSLKTFSKCIENLSDIAAQVKASEIECATKTIDECVDWYYGAFYKHPDVRKKYKFKIKPCPRAMRDKLLQIPGSIADKENTAEQSDNVELENADGVEVNEQGLGRYIFPVTFETFEQHVDKDKLLHYLVRKHIKEAKRQAYLSNESKGRKMLHRYYLTFYINPSHRLSSKHDYLRVPNALRENFLLPGKPLDELALTTMGNQPVLERQPAAEIEAVSSTESNNWLPIVSSIVSFEVFEQHIKNLYEIVWQLKMNDPVYECKGFEDCAFAYYLAFYLKPEIRERYAFVLNPCTLAMKKRILALPNCVDIARLEQLQIKHPYLSISSQDETQQASETEAQAMELDDNEVDSQMLNAEQQQNAVAISEPACSQESNATLEASETADIPMESAHSVQPAPQQSPLKSVNRIETHWPVESSAGKHIPMKSPHTVQTAPQQSTAASNERILKTVNGISYEFPVSLEAFKRYINYDSVIQELAHFRSGNKEKAAQILRDRARKIAIFKGYYNSFYIDAEKRNVCNYNFDAAPAELQVKLMQLAQPVKELTAPQMSQPVKELTAPTKQTVESPAELQELPTPENPTTGTVTKETEQRKSTSSIQYPVSFVLFQKIVFLDEIVTKMQKQAQYSQLDALQCQRVFYHNFYTQPKIRQEYEIVLRPCPAFVEDLLFKVPLVQNVMENAKKRKDIRLFKPYNLAAYIALTKDAHRRQLLFKQFLGAEQQVKKLTDSGATAELVTSSVASNNAAAAAESVSTAAVAATAIEAPVQPNSNDQTSITTSTATSSLNPTLNAAAEASSNALRVSRPKGASCVNSTAQVPIISIINLNSMQDLKFRVLKDNANSKPTENSATDINARQICKPSSKATPNAKEKQLDPTICHDKTNISSLSAASSKATTGTKEAPVEPVASQTKTNATSLKPASSNSTTVPKKEPVTPITSQVKRITTAARSNATSDAKEASVQSTATDAKATATSSTTMAKESPVEPNTPKNTPTEISSNINANQICQPSSNATTDAKDAPVEPVASQNKTNATSLNPASAKAKKSIEPITSQVKTNTTALSAARSNATSDAKEASVEPTTSQAKATATPSTTVATEAPATETTLAAQKLQLECVNFFAEASEEHNMRYLLRTSRGLMHSLWRILAHLSLADFRKYTSIQQAENIYEDEQVLSRCYEHVVGRGNWPLQLHVKLHLLQQLLHSNGVELDFTDLEELSPKVLHLDELLRFTNFYSIAEEDYWQRTGEEAPSVEAWFELGAKFYERCWQHNQWLRQVPVISTEHLKQLLSTVVPVEIREHEKLSALPACFNNLDDSSCPATQLDTSLPVTSFVDIDNVCPASQQQELIDDPLLANSEPLYIDLADPQAADPWLYVDQAEIIELPDEENSAEPLLLEISESEEEPVCDQQQRDTVEVPAEPAAIELPAKQQIKQEPIKFLNDLRFSLPDNSSEEFNCELINTDEKIVNLAADDDEEENKLACFRLASTQPQANGHSQEHSYARLMANIAQLEDASTAAPALIRKRPLAAAVTQVRKKARLMSDNVPQLTHGFRALPMTAVARIQPSGTSVEVASSTAEQQKEEPPAQESALTPSQAFAQDDTLMGSSQLAAPFVTQRKRRP